MKKELLKALFWVATVVILIGLLYVWKTFLMPLLSQAFVIDGGSTGMVQTLLLIIGVLAVLVLAVIGWCVWLTVKLKKK